MAGVINNKECQIDLRKRAPIRKGEKKGQLIRFTLNPGFNIVPDEVWDILCLSPHTKVLLQLGAIDGNAKITREDELLAQKLKDEAERELHEIATPERAASLVDGDSKVNDHVAEAHGSLAEGKSSADGSEDGDDLDF